MNNHKAVARLAGFFYLIVVLAGMFAHLFARAEVHVKEDAALTAANIVANAELFRLGLVADIVMTIAFVFLGLALYRLFESVNKPAAGALVVFVCVGAGMILVNLVFHLAALLIATGPSYADAFGQAGSESLVLLMLELHSHGYTLAGIFFGLWLLPLGYLGMTSRYFPRLLGILLVLAGVSYLIDTVLIYLVPDLPEFVHTLIGIPTYAELVTVLFLLVVGVRRQGTRRPAPLTPTAS